MTFSLSKLLNRSSIMGAKKSVIAAHHLLSNTDYMIPRRRKMFIMRPNCSTEAAKLADRKIRTLKFPHSTGKLSLNKV